MTRDATTSSESAPARFRVQPGGGLLGTLQVPGDKSISHRAIMFGALAEGVTEISGFLTGQDCLATLAAFRAMGVNVEQPAPDRLLVHGVGLHGLQAPAVPLDVGNSGTAMRLLAGILAGQRFTSTLTGDGSLRGRPMRRITEPLARMGARIDTAPDGTAPLTVHGGVRLRAIDYTLPMASAQVKSCVLLAGLYADGRTEVIEPDVTRDHTERMLAGFGYPVETDPARRAVALRGSGTLRGGRIEVPGDISSAAFFLVGASIAGASELTLTGVGVNPTRTGVIDILRLMGAQITVDNPREQGGEPVADLRVSTPGGRLRGIEIPERLVPLAIDEFPALFVAAALAGGETVLHGAAELRVKETDRIQAMADGLNRIGGDVRPTDDGALIRGVDGLRGGRVDSCGDHRIAMAFAMAALRADGPLVIDDCANVATSFPGFVDLAARAGLAITADASDGASDDASDG